MDSLDWGAEFLIISEIFGFTPSQISEFTLPQFIRYSRYSNEQKAFKLDVRTVNEYISALFGKREQKDPHAQKAKALASVVDCKVDFENKVNNIFNIRDARNSLRRKTGREEFGMDEIVKEISKLNKSDKYRFVEPKEVRKPKGK